MTPERIETLRQEVSAYITDVDDAASLVAPYQCSLEWAELRELIDTARRVERAIDTLGSVPRELSASHGIIYAERILRGEA